MGQPTNGWEGWSRDSVETGATFMPLNVPTTPENDYHEWAQQSRGWRKLLAAIVGGSALGTTEAQDFAKTLVSSQSLADAASIFWEVFETLAWLETFIRGQSEAIAGKDRAWQGQAADAFLTKMDWLGDILGNQADRFSTVDGIKSDNAVPQQLYQSANYLHWAQNAIKQLDYDYAAWAAANEVGGANGMVSISGTPYERPMAMQMASVVDMVAIEYDKVRVAATVSAGTGELSMPTPTAPNMTLTSPTFTTPVFTTPTFTTPVFTTPVLTGPGVSAPPSFTTPPIVGGPGPGPGGQFTTPLLSTPNFQAPGPGPGAGPGAGPGFTPPIVSNPIFTPPVLAVPGPITTPPTGSVTRPGPVTPPLFSTPGLGPNPTPPVAGGPGGFPTPPVFSDPIVTPPVGNNPIVTPPVFSNPIVTPPVGNNPIFTPPVVTAPGTNPGAPMFPPPAGMPGGGQGGSGIPEKPDANGLLGGNQQPWKPGGFTGIDLPGAPGGAVPGGLGLGTSGPGAPFPPGMPGPAGPAGGGGSGQPEKPDANGLLGNDPDTWQPLSLQGIDLPDAPGGAVPGGLGLGTPGPGMPLLPGAPGPAGPTGSGSGQPEKPDANGLLGNNPDDWQADTLGIDPPDATGGSPPGGLGLTPSVDPVAIPLPVPGPPVGQQVRARASGRGQEDEAWQPDGPPAPDVNGPPEQDRDRDEPPPPVVVVPTVVEPSIANYIERTGTMVAAAAGGTVGALIGAAGTGKVALRPPVAGPEALPATVRGQDAEERDKPVRPAASELLREDERTWGSDPGGLRVPTVRPDEDDTSAWDDISGADWLTGQAAPSDPDERSADV